MSPNRTRRIIIVCEDIQSKSKSVDELYLAINNHIFAHTVTDLYDHITGRYETPYFPNYERVCLIWVNIDNGLMMLGRNQIRSNATVTNKIALIRRIRWPFSERKFSIGTIGNKMLKHSLITEPVSGKKNSEIMFGLNKPKNCLVRNGTFLRFRRLV